MPIINIPGLKDATGEVPTIPAGSYLVQITRETTKEASANSLFPGTFSMILNAKIDGSEHEDEAGKELISFVTIPVQAAMSAVEFEEQMNLLKNLANCCELDIESDDFNTSMFVGCTCRWIVSLGVDKKTKKPKNYVNNYMPAYTSEDDE